MKFLVLLNQSAGALAASGEGDGARRVFEGLRAGGVEAEVRAVDPTSLESAARDAARPDSGFDAVVAGGGDGTVSAVAAAMTGTGRPLGVVPLGTHNHFAKDMNVPLDLDAAVRTLARGTVRDVDVGEMNGRVFLNFTGVGLHPRLVRHREAQRSARRRPRFIALAVALLRVLRRPPILRVRIDGGGRSIRRLTPSVIVCNNPHQMQVFGVENVSYPGRGVLNVYLARSTRWIGLVWLMVRAMARRLDNAKNFESMALRELAISMRRRTARVSIDGEVMDLATPLRYRVRRAALKVIVPDGTA